MQIVSDDKGIVVVSENGDQAVYAQTNKASGTGVSGVGKTGVRGDSSGAGGIGVQATATGASGFGLSATSANGTAAKATGKVWGVIAQSTTSSPDEGALAASSINGLGIYVSTDNGQIMRGQSSTGGGVALDAPRYHLRLTNAETRGAPTADTFAHQRGEIVETSSGDLWLCTGAGTPGTWRKLAGPATAGAFHVLATPARAYDTRPGFAPTNVGPKTPMPGGATNRTIDLRTAGGVPAGATAAMVSILVVGAVSGAGNATLRANGTTKPVANTMVWGGTAGRASTLAVTALDAQARCQVNTSIKTDIVIDVIGFYR